MIKWWGEPMLGVRTDQRGLFDAGTRCLEGVGKESFQGFLAGLLGTAVPSRRSTTSPNAIVNPTAQDARFEDHRLLPVRPTLHLR